MLEASNQMGKKKDKKRYHLRSGRFEQESSFEEESALPEDEKKKFIKKINRELQNIEVLKEKIIKIKTSVQIDHRAFQISQNKLKKHRLDQKQGADKNKLQSHVQGHNEAGDQLNELEGKSTKEGQGMDEMSAMDAQSKPMEKMSED